MKASKGFLTSIAIAMSIVLALFGLKLLGVLNTLDDIILLPLVFGVGVGLILEAKVRQLSKGVRNGLNKEEVTHVIALIT